MELQLMASQIRKLSITIAFILSIVAAILFPAQIKANVIGIFCGCLCGLMGFQMIVNMVNKIDGSQVNLQIPAFTNYVRRYLIYAIIFILCQMASIPLFAVIVGMFAHKISLFIYTFQHRKEDA